MKKILCLLAIATTVLFAACGPQKNTSKKERGDLRKTYEALKSNMKDADISLSDDKVTVILGEAVLFDINSDVINESYYSSLNKMAEILNRYPKTNILISGYTDNTGSDKLNQDLSKRRAEATKAMLVKGKVLSDRIYTWGLGSKNPIASNDTEAGRSKNRRVQFVIMYNYNATNK